jgi:hypothetical protein
VDDKAIDVALIDKPDLSFGRMHVHVHAAGVNPDIEEGDRIGMGGKECPVPAPDGPQDLPGKDL